jgi:putative membrane protein
MVSISPIRLRSFLLVLLSATALSACGMMRTETKTAAEQAKPLTDGEIAAVVHALNQGEIRQAELALQKSRNPEVIATAQTIITDHRDMDRQTMALAGVANIQPQENELSRSLRKQSQEMDKKLSELSGSEFDRAYLEGQAKMHKQAIDTVQNDLLPAAQDPRVRRLLTAAVPKLESHQQEAVASLEDLPRG